MGSSPVALTLFVVKNVVIEETFYFQFNSIVATVMGDDDDELMTLMCSCDNYIFYVSCYISFGVAG